MKKAYNSLNSEIMEDVPLIMNDKDSFFCSLFATHVKATAKFVSSAHKLMEEANNYMAVFKKEEIFSISNVITSDEESCWNKQIDLLSESGNESVSPRYNNTPSNNTQSNNKPPPPRPSNNNRVNRVKALYDFEAQSDQELSFVTGNILNLVDSQEGQDWWTAEMNGHTGLIPSNYVTRI